MRDWALGHVPSHIRLWGVAGVGLALDLWSKDLAFRTLDFDRPRVLIKNLCNLQLSLNPGALFGIGHGFAPIFVGASVLALLFVLYLFANSSRRGAWMHVALGLVLAGALGNLYDRMTQSAYVAYLPGGGRVVGTLVNRTDHTITLGDYPDGDHHRIIRMPVEPNSGPQPVVRDFVKIEAKLGKLSLWPWIFNIADALLVVGVAMLLISFWSDRRAHFAQTSQSA